MAKRYFEYKDAKSKKFWEVSVSGKKVNIRYGKLGTDGQTSLKELGTPVEAKGHAEKQAAGKVKKGYKEAKVKAVKKVAKKKTIKKTTKKVTKKVAKKTPAKGKANKVDQKAREAILEELKQSSCSPEYAVQTYKNDPEIVLIAVNQDIDALYYAARSLRADPEFMLKVVKHNGYALEYAAKNIKADREIVFAAVKEEGRALGSADKAFRADREIVLLAVMQDPSALEYVAKSLKSDREVVLATVKQDSDALEYADKSLKADREFMLKAVKQHGYTLMFADERLRADREVVLAAVKQDSAALEYADKSLKADREIVLKAVKQHGPTLYHADKSLKADREVVLAAVKQDESAIEYAGEDIRSDKIFLKKHITDESLLKKFLVGKKDPRYAYKINICGYCATIRVCKILKKTYDFFVDNNDLLLSHVLDDNDKDIPEDVRIGNWYDAGGFYCSDNFYLDESTLTRDRERETIDIPMDKKIFKKMGVKLIQTKMNFKNGVKKGKTGYFFLGHRSEKGGGNSNSELIIDHPFDPKKLKVKTCYFNGWETIETITYDNEEIECSIMDSNYKSEEFKVLKVKS